MARARVAGQRRHARPTRAGVSRSPSATCSAAPSRRSGWWEPRSGGDSGSPISVSPCRSSRSSRSRCRHRAIGGGEVGRVITAAFPVPLLELALGALIIFAACNLVVFQSWNWDNTKLLVYWYLVIALLIGALAAHWWRRGMAAGGGDRARWPGAPHRHPRGAPAPAVDAAGRTAITGPYTIANTQELQLASTIDRDDSEGLRVPHLRPSQRPGARRGRPHRGDGIWRMALELRHRASRPATTTCRRCTPGAPRIAATCPVPRSCASTTSATWRSTTG